MRRPRPAPTCCGPTCRCCASIAPTRPRPGSPASRSARPISGCACSNRRREQTVEVQLAKARAAIEAGLYPEADRLIDDLLTANPWEWRAVWLTGLAALAQGNADAAETSFNTVLGQVPGELAPKLALALACEHGGVPDVSEYLYAVCAASDANYVAPAAFGLARTREMRGDLQSAIAALDLVAPTSGAYIAARRRRAELLSAPGRGLADLALAAASIENLAIDPRDRQVALVGILTAAIAEVETQRRAADHAHHRERAGDRARAAHGGRARVPRARGAHAGSRDAGRASSTRRTRSGRGRWCERRRCPHCGEAVGDDRRVLRGVRPDARRGAIRRRPAPRRVGRARHAAARTARGRRRRPRSRPRDRPDAGPRHCQCGGEIDADGWCTRLRPARAERARSLHRATGAARRRRSATAACSIRATKTRSPSGSASTARSSSCATECRARPTATSPRWPRRRGARRRCRRAPAGPPDLDPRAEHWRAQLTRRDRRGPRRGRGRRADRTDRQRRQSAVVHVRRGGDRRAARRQRLDRRQSLLLVRRRRHRDPTLGRRLVGERRDRGRRRARRRRGRPARPLDHPLAGHRQPRRRPVVHVDRRDRSPGWLVVCSDGLWNYCSDAAALRDLTLEKLRARAERSARRGGRAGRLGERAGRPRQRHGRPGPRLRVRLGDAATDAGRSHRQQGARNGNLESRSVRERIPRRRRDRRARDRLRRVQRRRDAPVSRARRPRSSSSTRRVRWRHRTARSSRPARRPRPRSTRSPTTRTSR